MIEEVIGVQHIILHAAKPQDVCLSLISACILDAFRLRTKSASGLHINMYPTHLHIHLSKN